MKIGNFGCHFEMVLLVTHCLMCINQNIQCSISKKILMVKYFQKGGGSECGPYALRVKRILKVDMPILTSIFFTFN